MLRHRQWRHDPGCSEIPCSCSKTSRVDCLCLFRKAITSSATARKSCDVLLSWSKKGVVLRRNEGASQTYLIHSVKQDSIYSAEVLFFFCIITVKHHFPRFGSRVCKSLQLQYQKKIIPAFSSQKNQSTHQVRLVNTARSTIAWRPPYPLPPSGNKPTELSHYGLPTSWLPVFTLVCALHISAYSPAASSSSACVPRSRTIPNPLEPPSFPKTMISSAIIIVDKR